jgi:flagellar hook-associated protein 3 FlgL
MRTPTTTASNLVLEQIQRLARDQMLLQRRIATGQRIFLPADDPAAAGRLLANGLEQGALRQYLRNASAALEYSEASYTVLNHLKKISDRAGELAVLGTGTAGPQAMIAYAAEVDQLLEQALALGNTRFRSDHVLGGTAVDAPPYVATRDATGEATAVNYVGDHGRLAISLGEGASIRPTPGSDTNQGVATFMNHLVALRDALRSGDVEAASALRGPLEGAEDMLVGSLSEHGAIQLRIEISRAQQQTRLAELDRLASAEADADLPSTIVRLNQTTQAYEAALASASTILNMSLLDYLR